MSANTTVFDLFKTANEAAESAIDKNEVEVDKIKSDAFAKAGHDHADYNQWVTLFKGQLRTIVEMQKTPTQSVLLAKQTKPVTT